MARLKGHNDNLKYKFSPVEVLEWGDPSIVFDLVKGTSINEKLPRTLTFTYVIGELEGNILPVSATWTHIIMNKDKAPIFKYVGLTEAKVEKPDVVPGIEDLSQFIHNLFFQYTCHFYYEWQELQWAKGFDDPHGHHIDILKDSDIFNMADEVRTKLR